MSDYRPLPSWVDGSARRAILDFVATVTDPHSRHFVPVDARIAAFDSDGTLICERPTVQGAFIMQHLAVAASADPSLAERRPWRAALDDDAEWVDRALSKHYAGDDSDLKVLLDAVLESFSGLTVERFNEMVTDFFTTARHPGFRQPFTHVAYRPMLELLTYLESNGFTSYIVSGGGRDFLRAVSRQVFGIPPERVVGSAPSMVFEMDAEPTSIVRQAGIDILDDGQAKPIYLWDRAGQRPILAAGNANGDIPLMRYAAWPGEPRLAIVIAHDDAEREYAYMAGADDIHAVAGQREWTVVSMARDWERIF